MKRVVPTLLLLCALPESASAHGVVHYVSTPITPPMEFRWWFPVAAVILFLGTLFTIRRLLERPIRTAVWLSLLTMVLFAVPYYMVGGYASIASLAPAPGLGFPYHTLWGMGWHEAGWPFVRWNLYGCAFFLYALLVCGGLGRAMARLKMVVPFGILVYATTLAPYIVTGAWAHGWTGAYVHFGCLERLEILNGALVEYAQEHAGRLPTVDGMEALLKQMHPYIHIPDDRNRYLSPIDVCPFGSVYERHPEHYTWDTNHSGARLRDLVFDDVFFEEKSPISCPYHEHMGSEAASVFIDHILD